jgi:oxygen-dependent protoporphyrinogen oxidase
MARVAVIGGGLSGLVSALALLRARHSVFVVESGETFGGQIRTERSDGYVIELGAEGFIATSEALPRLAAELGIAADLIGQRQTRSLAYRAGTLHELKPGEAAAFLGFQVAREDTGAGIKSFREGMGQLIYGLRRALEAQVEQRPGFNVEALRRRERGYRLRSVDGAMLDADRVVIATSARAAAQLLAPVCGPAANPLLKAPTLSSVTVSLAYAQSAVRHPLDASGFVVATEDQRHGLRACTFVSSKFEARAPSGKVCLRAFFRPAPSEISVVTDNRYAQRAHEFLAEVLGIAGEPERSWVSRWPDALPVFEPGHQAAVAQLTTALAGSRIALAGSAFHGAGIDAAVRSALAVGERL